MKSLYNKIGLFISLLLNIAFSILLKVNWGTYDIELLYYSSVIILPIALYYGVISRKFLLGKICIVYNLCLFALMFYINTIDILSWTSIGDFELWSFQF